MSDEKYKLLNDDFIEYKSHKLFRIIALRDFSDVKKDDLGGYIESESNLSHKNDCWVYKDAQVYGEAKVYDEAKVYGEAKVFDEAQICDSARIYGEAKVYDEAQICDSARIYGEAEIYESAQVFDNAQVYGYAQVFDNAQVYGYAQVFDNAQVCDDAQVFDNAQVFNNAQVYDDVIIKGNSKIEDVHLYNDGVFNNCTFNLTYCLHDYIHAVLMQTYDSEGNYTMYKRVNKVSDGKYKSIYDEDFIYEEGKYVVVNDYDSNIYNSCSSGLHVSHKYYWDEGDTLIKVKVHKDDVITCLKGKLRVKKLFVIGEE